MHEGRLKKIGYVQTRPVFKDKERNFRQVADLLGGAEADLVVLPELFATGYTFETKREAADIPIGSPTTRPLHD